MSPKQLELRPITGDQDPTSAKWIHDNRLDVGPRVRRALTRTSLSASIAICAGFALGSAIHRLNALLSAEFVSFLAANAQRQATIEAWEAEDAAGRWVEPWPEEITWNSWWDLEDRSEEFEAGLGLEPPLRWAVWDFGPPAAQRRRQDIRTISELMGHSDVKTTMIDTHVLDPGTLALSRPTDLL